MEEWKPIEGFGEKYQVSSLGRVRNSKSGRILKQSNNKCDNSGYMFVCLFADGKRKSMLIHRLVGYAFLDLDPNAPRDIVVMHLDDNKTNNVLSNLKVGTQKENMKCNIKGEWGITEVREGRYQVTVHHKGEKRTTSRKTKEEAIALRDKWWSEMKD